MRIRNGLTVFITCLSLIVTLSGCFAGNPIRTASSSDNNGAGSGQSSLLAPKTENSLAQNKVEAAAGQMVAKYRINGRIVVEGVRELPKENAAIADLRFDGFEFATSNDGGQLLEARQYKTPADLSKRRPTDPLPSMEEMFPNRKQTYNGKGTATLTHYNDGRWVLKDVRWGSGFFTFTVTGNINIQ